MENLYTLAIICVHSKTTIKCRLPNLQSLIIRKSENFNFTQEFFIQIKSNCPKLHTIKLCEDTPFYERLNGHKEDVVRIYRPNFHEKIVLFGDQAQDKDGLIIFFF
jgi:hypothetical protein